MKKTVYLFNVLSVCLIVINSCASFRQVSCPPLKQNKELAREIKRIRNKPRDRRSDLIAGRAAAGNTKAGKIHRGKDKPNLTESRTRGSSTGSDFLSSIPGSVELNDYAKDNILASSDNRYGKSSSDLTIIHRSGDQPEEPIVPSDELSYSHRKQKKEIRNSIKVLRKGLHAAQTEFQQGTSKPAEGFGVASMVLGIVSLFVFGIPAGTLAVIFGGIALSRVRKDPSLRGRGMAIAGLVCGIIGIVGALYIVAILM